MIIKSAKKEENKYSPFAKFKSRVKNIAPSFCTSDFEHNSFSKKQEELILAMLPHVDFDGWGYKSLHSAAQSLGIPIMEAESYFPHAQPADFIRLANRILDDKTILAQQKNKQKLGVTATIISLLETRMQFEESNYIAVKKAFMHLMMPINNALALKLAWQTCDRIWLFAGSDKKDPAYFSKRIILLGVYITTWFVWLGYSKSNINLAKRFLQRQMSRSLRMGKKASSVKSGFPPKPYDIFKKGAVFFNSDFKHFMKTRVGLNS